MQPPASASHRGVHTRWHTVALAIIFGLLSTIATGPQAQRVVTMSISSSETFLAVP